MTLEPRITDHEFDPFTYPSTDPPLTVCIHLEGGRICDRAEDEHAPTEMPSPEPSADT